MFDSDVLLPAGHILRTDTNGATVELYAGGFRNPLDVAFNRDGEMFTFDADMEWDVGSPWYRPNRINHVVSGADYGWRRGTSKWPDYFPETLPSTLDIGLASPTGIAFASGKLFPPPYDDSLFIADWAYGRILAIHLTATGASYRGASELFVTGRPLNITDLTFGRDGAMYFVTGGRGTQSGLYRISWAGTPVARKPPASEDVARESEAKAARSLRRQLETFHRASNKVPDEIIDFVWPHLGSDDVWIRHAARVALEHQPVDKWRERALKESRPEIARTALIALARVGKPDIEEQLLECLLLLARPEVDSLRGIELTLTRMGQPGSAMKERLRARLEPLYPATHWQVNHRLCVLLVYLNAPTVIDKTLALAAQTNRPEDLMQYLFYLRYVRDGWTIPRRKAWFEAEARAESLQGARDYFTVLKRIRDEVIAQLSDAERAALQPVLAQAVRTATPSSEVRFVKEWRFDDFDLAQPLRGRLFASGESAFRLAQCSTCHRFGNEGGLVGPDLTQVASRFDRHALLKSILEPSEVIDEKYRQTLFVFKDGSTILGTIEKEDPSVLVVRENPLNTLTTNVRRDNIVRREPSTISPMPQGLVNVLQREQILDLLAFLEAAGNTNHVDFK